MSPIGVDHKSQKSSALHEFSEHSRTLFPPPPVQNLEGNDRREPASSVARDSPKHHLRFFVDVRLPSTEFGSVVESAHQTRNLPAVFFLVVAHAFLDHRDEILRELAQIISS